MNFQFQTQFLTSILWVTVLFFCGLKTTNAGLVDLEFTFSDPTKSRADRFGSSVAINGDHILVGAWGDDSAGLNVGQAHLYSASSGQLLQTFSDPTTTYTDQFGYSVSLHGDNVLIGASGDDSHGDNVGQAYLFSATTGELLRTFNDPNVTEGDKFGASVAIFGDNVLVGAIGDDSNGIDVGQAYLFSATSGALIHTFNDPTISGADLFSYSLAIDGDNILIGASGDDSSGKNVGQVHLFSATSGALIQTFDDPTATNTDRFGFSIDMDGNFVLVGANGDDTEGSGVGQAHLFDMNSGDLLHTFDDPTPTYFDRFGTSVAIDGNNILIGDRTDDTNGTNVGQVHLFDAISGSLLQTINDPTISSYDNFGIAVDIDGSSLVIGAGNDDTDGFSVGQSHLYTLRTSDVNAPATIFIMLSGLFYLVFRERFQSGYFQ